MKINKILFGIFLLSFTTFAQVNAPDSLTARVGEPGPLPLSVILFWHYNDTSTPVRFMIYKKTGPISDTTHQYVRQLPTFEKNYIDPLVQQGSIYSYYVTAMMGMVESAPSDTVQITVTGPQINSGKISGNLFTDSTNAPIPGGVVAVLPAALNSIFQGMELRTDSLGNFSGYVEAGDYYLFSTAPGYTPELFVGGPVSGDNLFFIHTLGDLIEGSIKINEKLYWGGDFDTLKLAIATGKARPDQVKFFVGYSGWSAGQLDREITENSWLVLEADPELIMKSDRNFWLESVKNAGGHYETWQNFPEDPNSN